MANARTGQYGGTYYGSYFNESEPLTNAEMQVNARYLYEVLHYIHGWTMNGVAAILGNMQAESSINPGRWQSDRVGSYSLGYGLVQWTPVTKYTDWCSQQGLSDPSEMDNNIARIIYELDHGGQWYATDSYDMSFSEFATSNGDPGTLAKAFLLNYERPADQSSSVQNYRASLANNWYTYLSEYYAGNPDPDLPDPNPDPDPDPEPEPDPEPPVVTWGKRKSGFNFVLFNQTNRRLRRG